MAKYSDADPLHFAVQERKLDLVQELLHKGMKPDVRDRNHITPLMVAARWGYNEIIEVLLNAGANVNAKDRASAIGEGRLTALHHACLVGRLSTAELLLKNGADPDCVSQSLRTPLSDLLEMGNKYLPPVLLEHGAAPNGPAECWEPPVVAAAGENDSGMVKELLKRRADPNRIGRSGNLALAYTTSVECARELLQHGAQVNTRNGEGNTPLLALIKTGSIPLIKCLIDAGADVNVTDKEGFTPLERVCITPRIEVAELLVAAGAHVNRLITPKVSVLDFISNMQPSNCSEQRRGLAEYLRGKGAQTAAALRAAK